MVHRANRSPSPTPKPILSFAFLLKVVCIGMVTVTNKNDNRKRNTSINNSGFSVIEIVLRFLPMSQKNLYYHKGQNFHWVKILPMAHILYSEKNFAKFNFANRVRYIPSRK